MSLLEVNNLTIRYGHNEAAVKNVSFTLGSGKILSLVGESGSGKTAVSCGTWDVSILLTGANFWKS